ncbi:MFS transporter [Klenkia terrae]
MSRISEVVAPSRLGLGFRWLLASSWTSNLGDGIALAAGPLLVASLTRDPLLVSLAAGVQWLPPLLFGLLAGAVTDRVDRRLLVVLVDLLRAAVLVVLTLAVATDLVTIAGVLVALFVLGTAEVFADNSSQTLLPTLTGFITVNQLAGPPLGAALFTVGAAWAFGAVAVLVALGAVLVSRIVLPPAERTERGPVHTEIVEGFRWVRHHPAVRTLVLTIFSFNLTFGAAWSVLVLYATQRLGLGEIGFGLVTTAQAVGGILGIAAYGWITARVSLGNLLRVGLVVETLTHLALALTTSPWVAMPVFVVFGAHAFVWGTTSVTVRQRAVPRHLQGRVGSVNLVGTFGGLVIGAGIGGLVAQRFGVTGPFWFAFAGSALFVVLIWGQLRHVAHADEAPPA